MNQEPNDHSSEVLATLIKQNQELLLANNELLQKMDRRYVRGIWFKVLWFAVLIGLPILFYSYFINSYKSMLGISAVSSGDTSLTETAVSAQQILDLLQNK